METAKMDINEVIAKSENDSGSKLLDSCFF